MVELEINGVPVEAEQGSMIIEAADAAGIRVPRFCYHKKLSIAANCRMCLVEVDKARKPMPACATPVTDGMKVYTHSKMAQEAQKAVMEFLLINHPLDCPICDQGGECELQDVSVGYGGDISQFTEGKRVVADKNIGPLISTEFTRCIHCTRCVRFGDEIAGMRELGAVGRGEHTEIGTYIEKSIDSELSGNVIDICPVGALTSKPFRFSARAWELRQHASVAAHDCLGSNIFIHTRQSKVMRVVPRENDALNEVWISDRDRFSYEAINADTRAVTPMIKHNGQLEKADWSDAITYVASGLQKIAGQYGVDQIAGLASSSATLEELYLFQRLFRGMGCANIDFRTRLQDFADQDCMGLAPTYSGKIAEIEHKDAVLLIGSNLRKEQPMINHHVRKVSLYNGTVSVINPVAFNFNYDLAHENVPQGGDIVSATAAVLKAVLTKNNNSDDELDSYLADVNVDEQAQALADHLCAASAPVILTGDFAISHPKATLLRRLTRRLVQELNADYAELHRGANAAGAWMAGCLPHRLEAGKATTQHGLHARDMFEQPLRAYVLFAVEPELDSLYAELAKKAMKQADMVVCITSFVSEEMKNYANVILPLATFAETSGTYINIEGSWQSFTGAVKPQGEARPGWKILRVLANQLSLQGFDYNCSTQVRDELKTIWQSLPQFEASQHELRPRDMPAEKPALVRISETPIYATDMLVRRAESLQQTQDAESTKAYVNPKEVAKHHLGHAAAVRVKHQDTAHVLPLVEDERVPMGAVLIPDSVADSMDNILPFAAIDIEQA